MTLPPVIVHFEGDLPLTSYFDAQSATLPDPQPPDTAIQRIARARGETVVLVRCLSAAFDDWDGVDPAASEYDLRLVRGLFSGLSEKESRNLAGRGIDASRRCTLGESLRVRPDREGQGDLIFSVPDAEILGVSGSGSDWTVSIARTGEPVSADYPVEFAGGAALIGLDRSEYQVYRVAEVSTSRHPFARLVRTALYLQEAPGR